ncbi:MAG: hypothetical protein RJB66_22 [Pseudomonadota bacterium]
MNKSNNNINTLRTKMILRMLTASTCLIGCAQSPFDLSRLNANEKELYSSELLKQSESRSTLSTETTPGVSAGNTGTDTIVPIAPPIDPCQLSGFQLYQDKNLDGQISDDEYLGLLAAYSGSLSAAQNYGYSSASAHPKAGPQPEAFKSKLFLYTDSEGTHLNFFNNVDYDKAKAGSAHNKVAWDITVKGNSLVDDVKLSDDKLELKKIPMALQQIYPPAPIKVNKYQARWEYWRNTDGGIIGPIKDSSSEIKIEMKTLGDLKSVEFASANGSVTKVLASRKGLRFVIKSQLTIDQPMTTMTSADGVASSLPICGPQEPEVSLVINPVSKVDILTYDQLCDSRPGMMCPMMMRLNDVIVSGLVNGGFVGGAGSSPQATVKFSQRYLECEAEAKQALALKLPLVIKGHGNGFANTTNEVINLSDITACFVDRPAKAL